jgi:uncharacterized protein YndB with AHSA1/START domain
MQATDSEVRREITVNASPERAFAVFTDGFDSWWPRSHHIAPAELEKAIIEPKEGGRWYELGIDGSECDWGEVLAWDPPHRVVLSWRLDGAWAKETDPERYSEIEVSFKAEGDATRVTLVHDHFERHNAAAALRVGVSGEGGWNGLLAAYAEAASSAG